MSKPVGTELKRKYLNVAVVSKCVASVALLVAVLARAHWG